MRRDIHCCLGPNPSGMGDKPLFAYICFNSVGLSKSAKFSNARLDERELLCNQVRISHRLRSAVLPKGRLEIEECISGFDFESNAGRRIPVDQQSSIAQNSVNQVGQDSVENHQIHFMTELSGQVGGKVLVKPFERRRRIHGAEDGNVDVAFRMARSLGMTAKQITATMSRWSSRKNVRIWLSKG